MKLNKSSFQINDRVAGYNNGIRYVGKISCIINDGEAFRLLTETGFVDFFHPKQLRHLVIPADTNTITKYMIIQAWGESNLECRKFIEELEILSGMNFE